MVTKKEIKHFASELRGLRGDRVFWRLKRKFDTVVDLIAKILSSYPSLNP